MYSCKYQKQYSLKIIYDNIIFSLQKIGGVSKYWYELVKRISKVETEIIFYEPKNENIFRHKKIDVVKESNLNVNFLRYLPFLKKIPSKSVFHSSYYRVSLQKDIINVTTIYDFNYEYFRSGIARHIHSKQKRFALNRSDGIICISKNTKNDLLKFYPHIDDSKIKVIYIAAGEEFKKINGSDCLFNSQYSILGHKKYILYVGERSHYKNFNMALQVISKLVNYSLVIVGGKEMDIYEKKMVQSIQDRVYHFKGIGSDDLNILYNNAFCLLYPSSYEGFGIPVAEAMKSGCPVVSTNKSSIPEVAGHAGLLVDNICTENFILEIKRLENINLREEQVQKGLDQSKKFSWDICFEETYGFYQDIFKSKWE